MKVVFGKGQSGKTFNAVKWVKDKKDTDKMRCLVCPSENVAKSIRSSYDLSPLQICDHRHIARLSQSNHSLRSDPLSRIDFWIDEINKHKIGIWTNINSKLNVKGVNFCTDGIDIDYWNEKSYQEIANYYANVFGEKEVEIIKLKKEDWQNVS